MTLKVNVEDLRAAASQLRTASDAVPVDTVFDASGSGSARIAQAVESFNMWAKVTGLIIAGELRTSAEDAEAAATAFETAEAALAAQAG